jgi:osmoprotectant transport system substrate-binding protein/osmoprotectant transport system permease protein
MISQVRWLEHPVLALASIVQTVPSLALLAIMVPLLAVIGLPSIGFLPAFLALTLYSVLPVLRNTVTGLAGVDPAHIEAARGVGMTKRQELVQVQLPLAMPVLIAGIRTATVWTVGMATLSTPVGAPSLGNYIFSGLQTRNLNAVLVGCVAAALLALTLDALVRLVATGWERQRRGLLMAALAVLSGLYLYAGVTLARTMSPAREREIVIGAKTFTEQYILSEILARQITHRTGRPARVAQSLGSTVAFDALRTGGIDAYVDYSGTIWATIMHREAGPARSEVLRGVEGFLQEEHGIKMAGSLGFENAYALAMRSDRAKEIGVRTISDLAPHASGLTIGGDYEFFQRAEWKTIRDRYRIAFKAERSMDPSLMYQAVANGSVDVISAFSTDGRIAAYDLALLDDDEGAIPPYDAIVLVGRDASRRADVLHALEELSGTIDANAMRRMNLSVDRDKQNPKVVAQAFLDSLWSKR